MRPSEPSGSKQGVGPLSGFVVVVSVLFAAPTHANPCELPLIITEVHVDGLEDPDSEWFELTNAGAVPIDLSPWSFADQANQGAATEGAVRFPDGLNLAPFESIVIAFDGAQFQAERGLAADFEYGVDSVSGAPYLSRASDWSSGRTLSLSNSADELLLVCGLVVRDVVRWGIAGDDRLAAPSPSYGDGSPQNGPRTFERQSVDPWPAGPGAWVSSSCVSPGVAPNAQRAPAVQPMRVLVPYSTTVEFRLSGRDSDTATPTYILDTAGLSGTLVPLPGGVVRYTPPITAVPLSTSFRFVVADACSSTHRQRVDLLIGPPACDPGQGELLLSEVAPEGDNLAWVEIYNPASEEVDLSYLALGDAPTLGDVGVDRAQGLVLFAPGAVIGPQEFLTVAFSAGDFQSVFGVLSSFEWYRDSDLLPNELALDPRGGHAAVTLPRVAGRVGLYACDGSLVDSLGWGGATSGWATSPGPYPLALPADPTSLSYERRSLSDTDSASDWLVQRCPTPGEPRGTTAGPVASPASFPRSDSSALSGRFAAADADSSTLSYRAFASAGTLTVDPQTGDFTFTPPGPGRHFVDFEASDGCRADQARVTVCVQTTEVVGNAEDEDCDGLAQCWADEDGDGFGSVLVGVAPGHGCSGPGLSAFGGDCDDDPGACGEACFPGAPELCDDYDNDCSALTLDGVDDERVGADCDADDANACIDDATICVSGDVVCADDPSGDTTRVEVCDANNLDEDCDGAADDLDAQGATGKVATYADLDGDGQGAGTVIMRCDPLGRVLAGGDCDDDPSRCGAACRTGLTESRAATNCSDGYDNDCDGTSDLDDACFEPVTCYLDRDGDNVGRAGGVVLTGPAAGLGCASHNDGVNPVGSYVAVSGDCDDDPAQCGAACRPGLPELCDGFDNDCASATVDGSADIRVGVVCDSPVDLDACLDEVSVCQAGQVVCPNNPAGDAGRIEVCDPLDVDEDCDGLADDLDLSGAAGKTTFYRDLDGDGRGAEAVLRCDGGAGFVAQGGDCDDDTARCGASCRPGLTESRAQANCADTFDNDCDGQSDNDPECFSLVLCYLDRDGDDFGDFATENLLTGQNASAGCAAYLDGVNPAGSWVENGLDCDDNPAACGAACHPDALEVCDGLDNDCLAATADGSGDARIGVACDGPDANKCLDDRAACVAGDVSCVDVVSGDSARIEVCDGLGGDEDCDGFADDLDPDGPPSNALTFYRDLDGDGFGNASELLMGCVLPAGAAANALDCDDDPETCGDACQPGLSERCDGRDNDCDPATADGSGDTDVGAACDADDANLCEDDVATCVDGALGCVDVVEGDEGRVEVCDAPGSGGAVDPANASDEDCDGFADDLDPGGAAGELAFYRDRDEDGFGDPDDTVRACVAPPGYVVPGGDCDDDPAGCGERCAPGLEESAASGRCGDDLDNDCDGGTDSGDACEAATCYLDKDGDKHGDPAISTSLPAVALAAGCSAYDDGTNPVGAWVVAGDDCDDLLASVNPSEDEVGGNEVDEDCDGQIACYVDNDGDGFASDMSAVLRPVTGGCGDGFAAHGGDCDDDPTQCGGFCSPAAVELCDGLDNDCDDATDETCDRPGVLGGGSGCGTGALDGLPGVFFGLWFLGRRTFRAKP